jgi:ribonuclease T2
VPDGIVADMLDIMPSPGLIGHQWRKHGSCSGLSQEDYFALTRAAFERVALPEPDSPRVRPRDFAGAVASVNEGLGEDGFAVTCDGEFLREIRICMQEDLTFRACPEVTARSCPQTEAMMPPVPR